MKKPVWKHYLEACEYYGVGSEAAIETNKTRAVDARSRAAHMASRDGHSQKAIERTLSLGVDVVRALLARPVTELHSGIIEGNAVVYDMLDARECHDEGVGIWKRKRTMNEVALALMDSLWNPATIEYQMEIPIEQIYRAAELEGGLQEDGSIRFDRFTWLKQELTPVWVIGKYPGYTTNQPPMGEFEPDKNHHYVWMEKVRYQIYKPSITRRFVDEDKREFDENFHIGWSEGWD